MTTPFTCFLFDNGSHRAESTLSLRALAARLQTRLGHEVNAVSLLHSTRVPAEELGGERARLLEAALEAWAAENPKGKALLIPLFFGRSGALVDYIPERMVAILGRHPGIRVVLAAPLVNEETPLELAAIFADRVRAVMVERGWVRPKVLLCDHGTPLPAVTEVRERLSILLRAELAEEVAACGVASMERREGDAFAFNEPLLATALRTPPFVEGNVVVALQFLSPGRHAGPGGDVAEICTLAETEAGGRLVTAMTATIAEDPRLVEVLCRRAQAARLVLDGGYGVRWQNLSLLSAPSG